MAEAGHQIECDPTLLAIGGSRITHYGARNGYNLVQEDNRYISGMKVIVRKWQPETWVKQGPTEPFEEFELRVKAKGKLQRVFFYHLEDARTLHQAAKNDQWNPLDLAPLPPKADAALKGLLKDGSAQAEDDVEYHNLQAAAAADVGELKAAAKDAIDSSSLSRGSMSGGGRQVAEAADTSYHLEHATLHFSNLQLAGNAELSVDIHDDVILNDLSYMDQELAVQPFASCAGLACPAPVQNTLSNAATCPSNAAQPTARSTRFPLAGSRSMPAPMALLGSANNAHPSTGPLARGIANLAIIEPSLAEQPQAYGVLPATAASCSQQQSPSQSELYCHETSVHLPSNPFDWQGSSSSSSRMTAAAAHGCASRSPAGMEAVLPQCPAPTAALPSMSESLSNTSACTRRGAAAPSLCLQLGLAAEAAIIGNWHDCNHALATAASIATQTQSAAICAAVTAAGNAAESLAMPEPNQGPLAHPPPAAVTAAQPVGQLPGQGAGADLLYLLAQALAAVTASTGIPGDLPAEPDLFIKWSLHLWPMCIHPSLLASNNNLTVGKEIGRGGFGRVCEVVGANNEVVDGLAVKIFSGTDAEFFDDAEAFNELYYLRKHVGRKGIVQMLGAGVLQPNTGSNDKLRDIFSARPVFCIVLERMDSSLDVLLQSRTFQVVHCLGFFKQIMLVLCDLQSQPDFVYAHRDIKSHNVLIKEFRNAQGITTYKVCLCDLGSMASYRRGSSQRFSGEFGTPEYMAPDVLKYWEQDEPAEKRPGLKVGDVSAAKKPILYDETVDTWSAMMTLLDMITGLPCVGKILLRREPCCKAKLWEYALLQLQRLVNGKIESLGVPGTPGLGLITASSFEVYEPVITQLISPMAGLYGQTRSSANSLLADVDALIALYNKYDPPTEDIVFCL